MEGGHLALLSIPQSNAFEGEEQSSQSYSESMVVWRRGKMVTRYLPTSEVFNLVITKDRRCGGLKSPIQQVHN